MRVRFATLGKAEEAFKILLRAHNDLELTNPEGSSVPLGRLAHGLDGPIGNLAFGAASGWLAGALE